ncbi:H-NS histone family protein [Pseudoalteromonas sp. BZB3]|uniref:H-NS histone family protein n=1 Tax=Pseudoalteromonas sp. BZB3 TaxID=3136670 RepID=UPI0032C44EAC
MKEIRSFIKSASVSELEKALGLINDAIASQKAQEAAKAEVLALIKDKGLTVEDLLESAPTDKRSKVAIKYRMEKDGEIFEWSGRGKRPKVFVDVDLQQYAVI